MSIWHSLPINEVLKKLNAEILGLSENNVLERQKTHGLNELKKEKAISPLKIFFRQFANYLIVILLIALIVSAALGEILDAAVILAIVLMASLLGFFQEYRSEKAMEALRRISAPTARVLRDGVEIVVPAISIVPGDILVLQTGDKIAADARLIEAANLKTDESSLTGESVGVSKKLAELSPETELGDRACMLYAGTLVVYGRGRAVVTATGMETEFGKIAKMLSEVENPATPLEKKMEEIGKWLGSACLVICLLAIIMGVAKGHPFLSMLLWGISLAVAAVPESLPAVVTGALSIGVSRMAKRKAIIRRLAAVETLGSITVICSDKTGTLTKNEMTVRSIFTDNRLIDVSGLGYSTKGDFTSNGENIPVKDHSSLYKLLEINALCNDSSVITEKGITRVSGDPMEAALLVLAEKGGLFYERLRQDIPRLDEVPFDSQVKRMVTIHNINGRRTALVKGAPEILLNLSSKILEDGVERGIEIADSEKIARAAEIMAGKALRVLGCAYRVLNEGETDPKNDLVFVGIVGMIDPPREEVKDAIIRSKRAGIRPVMITGDHKLTAMAIAKELGFAVQNGALEGRELDALTDFELEEEIFKISVFARVNPEHKLRIVKAFKRRGEIVALTGDGINDAPALKTADIGVSMGISGTDVTKEASDMVLADDNYATIVAAIEEGRHIYSNIRKYLLFLLHCNLAEIFFLAGSFFVGLPLPLVAIQILWVNLTTDGLPALALGVEPKERGLMEAPPRNPKAGIFTGITGSIIIYALAITVILTAIFVYYLNTDAAKASTMALAGLVVLEMAMAFNCRSVYKSVFETGLFKNRFLVLAVASSMLLFAWVIYWPVLNGPFNTVPLSLRDWVTVLCAGLIMLPVAEIWKAILRKKLPVV